MGFVSPHHLQCQSFLWKPLLSSIASSPTFYQRFSSYDMLSTVAQFLSKSWKIIHTQSNFFWYTNRYPSKVYVFWHVSCPTQHETSNDIVERIAPKWDDPLVNLLVLQINISGLQKLRKLNASLQKTLVFFSTTCICVFKSRDTSACCISMVLSKTPFNSKNKTHLCW